jgi:hypothetical protein
VSQSTFEPDTSWTQVRRVADWGKSFANMKPNHQWLILGWRNICFSSNLFLGDCWMMNRKSCANGCSLIQRTRPLNVRIQNEETTSNLKCIISWATSPCKFTTPIKFYHITWRHIPQDNTLHNYHRGNLKSDTKKRIHNCSRGTDSKPGPLAEHERSLTTMNILLLIVCFGIEDAEHALIADVASVTRET